MASDPTDLIRSVDLVHVVGYGHPPNGGPAEKFCKRCQSAWPCEVRRLRDALETSEFDRSVAQDTSDRLLRDAAESRAAIRAIADYAGADADVKDILRCIRELAADRRALAEANAAIERVEAFRRLLSYDRGSTTCEDIAGRLEYELRGRAIEGPARGEN